MKWISMCNHVPTIAFLYRKDSIVPSIHSLERFFRNIPSTTALQEVALQCVLDLYLDVRLLEPFQLEELMLRLVSQSRLSCFTIELPDQVSCMRWKRTLQRQFPQLHAKNILKLKYTRESYTGDDRGRTLLVS